MVYELIESIAAKRGGENAPDSLVWAQAAGTVVDFLLTIPDKWVGYLIMCSGYTSGDKVRVTFIDHDGFPRWEWTQLTDTMKEYKILPILEKWYKGTIKFRFKNESTAARTISWCTEVLLIPEAERENFEKDVKAIADIIPTILELKDIKTLLVEIRDLLARLPRVRI